MEPRPIDPEIVEEIKSISVETVRKAERIEITSQVEFEAAAEFLSARVKPALKKIAESFDPIIKTWHQGHKLTLKTKKDLASPLLEAEKKVKEAMGRFTLEQQRIEAEAHKAEVKLLRDKAEQSIIDEAAELLTQGRDKEAEELLESLEEESSALPSHVSSKPKAKNTSVRMISRYRVVDPHKIKRKYLSPDLRKIQKAVTILKEDCVEEVGGIEYYEEPSVAVFTR